MVTPISEGQELYIYEAGQARENNVHVQSNVLNGLNPGVSVVRIV